VKEKIEEIKKSNSPVNIQIGISESPKIRADILKRIEEVLKSNQVSRFNIEVFSSYKQGFFWIKEKIIPELKGIKAHHLVIKFAEEKDDMDKPKRFYSDPSRWMQELYPVDEIIAKESGILLERIIFQMKEGSDPVYEVMAFDEDQNQVFSAGFSPRWRKDLYLRVLPEWGDVKLTTGWVKISCGSQNILDTNLKSDLERFWDYYQDKILPEVHSYILKKTANKPSFKKQPYFKRLQMEMWFSEPDFKLGLDEEIISSLEAIHDELYFDTLDFLRGITEVELEDEEIQEDTSRYSAPGNVFPLVHSSQEGKKGKVKVTLEDWMAKSPKISLKWKEKGGKEQSENTTFPFIKPASLTFPCLIYNGEEEKVEKLITEVSIDKEKDYLSLIEILNYFRRLTEQDAVTSGFSYSCVSSLAMLIRHKKLEKEEDIPLTHAAKEKKEPVKESLSQEPIVPTDKIMSPQMVLDAVRKLDASETINTYIGGMSYENRKIPVLEIFSPLSKYVSLPRLVTFKPTLFMNGRQHANEVSATNYILKLAENMARDDKLRKYLNKMNLVLHPMENPDGAELAYRLQKITPFHSLHAGRYSSLGIDIGYQVSASKPLLPEAKVRKHLYDKWLPDIHLNLHGYPSHEWVQQFSNYAPYLFRDYWIPKGWFAYYRSLSLPIYTEWKKAGEDLRHFIIEEMNANNAIMESNKKFYDRYFRWASRWQPYMNYLELYDGLNLYAKRRSSRESRLSGRRKITYVEETPELMDETAHDSWLDFLCEQGLTYLMAHLKYLSQVKFQTVRIEEESQDRIHIQHIRKRPGSIPIKK
jgi:hypothetical protein